MVDTKLFELSFKRSSNGYSDHNRLSQKEVISFISRKICTNCTKIVCRFFSRARGEKKCEQMRNIRGLFFVK